MSATAALAPAGTRSPDKSKGKALPSASATSSDDAAAPAAAGAGTTNAKNVASPGEMCGFVDTLLNQLESRFDDMSEQVLNRMTEMSGRIDNLETAIADLMHDNHSSPTTPSKK